MEIQTKSQNILVLNNIRSAENVGACFRIADSCNCKIICQGITPHPKVEYDSRLPYIINKDTLKISKTATESINNVSFSFFNTVLEVVNYLKSNQYAIYSLENNLLESTDVFSNFKLCAPFALIVGNEKEGVDPVFLANSKQILSIPMYGKNRSLNVSVATGIAMYQIIHKFLP